MLSILLGAGLAAIIESPQQSLPADEIRASVAAVIRERLAAQGSTAQAQIVGRIRAQSLPAGEVDVELGKIAGRWPRARAAVPVRLLVDGRHVRSMTVWIELQDEREVPAYRHAYPAHTPGGDIRIEPAMVDMICCTEAVAVSAERLDGLRTRGPVRAGAPALQPDFEPMPDVRAQSEVAIEVRRGPVRIMTSGIALDDGAIGESIAVRPERSAAAVMSRVVAEQKVRIDE